MEKTTLTHIDSLDSDTVIVDGINVEVALHDTVSRGKQIIKRRRTTMIVSSIISVTLIFIVVLSLSIVSRNTNHVQTATDTTTVKPIITSGNNLSQSTESNAKESDVTFPATQNIPVLVSRTFGDKSMCILSTDLPGAGEVAIGTSKMVHTWDTTQDSTYTVITPRNTHIIFTLASISENPNKLTPDLAGGNSDYSYADISPNRLKLCEGDIVVTIETSENNIFQVTTETR